MSHRPYSYLLRRYCTDDTYGRAAQYLNNVLNRGTIYMRFIGRSVTYLHARTAQARVHSGIMFEGLRGGKCKKTFFFFLIHHGFDTISPFHTRPSPP